VIVGRRRELAQIEDSFREGARLVTIEGAPGVGKTHVARAFVEERDAIWVDLRAATRPAELEDALARTVGWTRSPRDDLGSRLDELGDRALVLDNFEQILGARTIVARWLESSQIRVLVTSREPLRLPEERLVSITPLTPADAAILFERGATAARRSFRLETERGPVTELLEQLGGLPLAIELASAWCDALSVETINAQIRGSMALLAPLEAALEASLARLGAEDRACFLACAVFARHFRLDALDAILGGAPDLVQSIARLVRKKLVEVRWTDGVAEYGLLAVTRTFAAQRLAEAPEHALLVARHREHFLETALRPDDGPELLAAYDRAHDASIRGDLALRLDPLLYDHGPFDRHLPILNATVAAKTGDDLARALHARARALRVRGRVAEAWADLERAAELAGSASAAPILRMMGVIGRNRAALAEAEAHLTRALEIAELAHDEASMLRTRDDLAIVSLDRGDIERAERHLQASLALAGKLGDLRYRGIATEHLGLARHLAGDGARARALYDEALALHRAARDRRFEAWTLGFVAYLDFAEGRIEAAVEHATAASALLAAIGDPRTRAFVEAPRIAALIRAGEIAHAVEALGRAREGLDPREDGSQLAALDLLVDRTHGRAPSPGPATQPVEVALMGALLLALTEPRRSLRVSVSGLWFEDAEGRRVSLARRRPLRRMLARLIEEHVARPGRGLEWASLMEAGWPGERLLASAGARRVYVGIATLRKLGLDQGILRAEEGYYLATGVEVSPEI